MRFDKELCKIVAHDGMRNKTPKWLVIEPSVSGHRIEYYNHLCWRASQCPDDSFLFVVSSDFPQTSGRFSWPKVPNVEIDVLDAETSSSLNGRSGIVSAFRKTALLLSKIRQYRPTHVFLLEAQFFLPFLPIALLFSRRGVKVDGIQFQVYPYRWKRVGKMTVFQDWLKLWMFSRFSCFRNIYVINDNSAVCYYNRKFRTDRFRFAPDPIVPIDVKSVEDVRRKFSIAGDKVLLCQLGMLGRTKGTLNFVEALALLAKEERGRFACILAGRVSAEIKDELRSLVASLECDMRIVVVDEFCSYDFLGSVCMAADYAMLTYKKNEGSSGFLGIAAQFGLPVVSTSEHMLGKLVRRNRLGVTTADVSPVGIASLLRQLPIRRSWQFDAYREKNNVRKFAEIMFEP